MREERVLEGGLVGRPPAPVVHVILIVLRKPSKRTVERGLHQRGTPALATPVTVLRERACGDERGRFPGAAVDRAEFWREQSLIESGQPRSEDQRFRSIRCHARVP